MYVCHTIGEHLLVALAPLILQTIISCLLTAFIAWHLRKRLSKRGKSTVSVSLHTLSLICTLLGFAVLANKDQPSSCNLLNLHSQISLLLLLLPNLWCVKNLPANPPKWPKFAVFGAFLAVALLCSALEIQDLKEGLMAYTPPIVFGYSVSVCYMVIFSLGFSIRRHLRWPPKKLVHTVVFVHLFILGMQILGYTAFSTFDLIYSITNRVSFRSQHPTSIYVFTWQSSMQAASLLLLQIHPLEKTYTASSLDSIVNSYAEPNQATTVVEIDQENGTGSSMSYHRWLKEDAQLNFEQRSICEHVRARYWEQRIESGRADRVHKAIIMSSDSI